MASIVRAISRAASLGWLTGPILDKELRVSSRRRRNYLLRLAYLAAMGLTVVFIWVRQTRGFEGLSGAENMAGFVSRMAEVGKSIIVAIILFQFVAGQLVAVILPSSAINEEINSRTLGTLASTPITGLQIVMGKLLGKLWQVLILLAISVPILAVVRIFGGVPWDYVIAGTCITLTAIIHAAAYSLYFSIRARGPIETIIVTLIAGAVLFGAIPWLVTAIAAVRDMPEREVYSFLAYVNPFVALHAQTMTMLWPAARPVFHWPWHCAVILASAGLTILMAARTVRRVALGNAMYGNVDRYSGKHPSMFTRRKPAARRDAPENGRAEGPSDFAKAAGALNNCHIDLTEGGIAPVRGSPVLWHELRSFLVPKKFLARLCYAALVVVLASVYAVCWALNGLGDRSFHTSFLVAFFCAGVFGTAILPATRIAAEKERRTWLILMATPQSDWQILRDKFIGGIAKTFPFWIFLVLHLAVFGAMGYVRPGVVVLMLMLMAWTIIFLTATGLYFSARLRKAVTAVLMNIGLGLLLWGLVPLLLAIGVEIAESHHHEQVETILCANPVVQAITIAEGNRRNEGWPYVGNIRVLGDPDPPFSWPTGSMGLADTFMVVLVSMIAYGAASALFLGRAKRLLRRNLS